MKEINGELMPLNKQIKSESGKIIDTEIKSIAPKKEIVPLHKQLQIHKNIIFDLRCQVVNGLPKGFEIEMIFESQYRARGIARTKIGFIVFETNKYGINGFDVIEIVPFDDKEAIDNNVDSIKRIK